MKRALTYCGATALIIFAPVISFAQESAEAASQTDSSQGNPVAGLFAFIILMGLYFTPGIIATVRKHPSFLAIWACNFFFGWTMIGWIITLIWSLGRTFHFGAPQNIVVNQVNAPQPAGGPVEPRVDNQRLTPNEASEQIDGLIALKEKGHLSEEDFLVKKAAILSRIS